jgi:hypothetical protein
MNDFLKMDIFFLTTTVVVLLLGVFLIVALYYLIKILKSIDHVAQNVSAESDNVRGDISVLRGKIRDEGMKVKHFMEFFMNVAARKTGRKSRTAHHKERES